MHPKFSAVVDALHPAYERLLECPPVANKYAIPNVRVAGIYLFSEGSRHQYVGRSNDIRGRYGRHCDVGATHRMAAFAFRLAREATGNLKATYKSGEGSRLALSQDPSFIAAFEAAKQRIRAMDFRFVAESDPVRQTILEVYCAVVLATPYNDFDNH